MHKMFKITGGKGFHITFPNGLTLSTQFGYGNYCENEDNISLLTNRPEIVASDDVEIAVFDKDGLWVTREMAKDVFGIDIHDDVMGHITINDWLKIYQWCVNQK